ncbi:MAG: hypothetical protein NTW95_04665 [Candidatus Aminicenantes bacterium]|nr:hypothetical protein [Candidatus Aminicenantes bacterium]
MKHTNDSSKNIRIFLVLLAVFAALILWRGFKNVDGTLKIEIFAALAVVLVFFIILPRFFAPVYKIIMSATGFIGNAIFLIIAATVFFVLLTPISLIMRLFGKAFMTPRYDRAAVSYFESPQTVHGYDKQY